MTKNVLKNSACRISYFKNKYVTYMKRNCAKVNLLFLVSTEFSMNRKNVLVIFQS